MIGQRIELMERYVANRSYLEELKEQGVKNLHDYTEHKYRRTNPRLVEIERIVEVPENANVCKVLFYSGEMLTVKGSFDDLCIQLNDMENNEMSDL